MGQQQIKVTLSLGTKLLISVVLLLILSISFLDVSTIWLLRKDMRAYTYQAQSTEALLVGREIVSKTSYALNSLRLSLASIDPIKPITPQQTAALQSVMNNQSEIAAVSIGLINPGTGVSIPITKLSKNELITKVGLDATDLQVPPEILKASLPDLLESAFAFFNLSSVGRPPLLGIAMADLKFKDNPNGIPVAIGFLSLNGFGNEIKASNLSIATKNGWLLFDTNPADLFARKNISEDPLFDAARGSQFASGTKEYEFEKTTYLGSYVRPGYDLVVMTKTDWRTAMRATYLLSEKFILLALMAIGCAIVFAILFSKTLTAPLLRLYDATREVAAGKFDVQLSAKSRDEIGVLTTSFVAMSHKINDLIQESVKKAHIENQIAIASTVQQTLIPPPRFKNDFLEIHSHYQSADQCGGDWWGFFGVNRKVCVMIADATGHGLPSALITASARSCFSVMHKLAQEDPDFSFAPSAMLAYANRVVHDAASGQIMMTFFAGVIDVDAGTLTYASAGHNPPWLFRKENGSYKMSSLIAQGLRLGEARDVAEYEEKTVPIGMEDILFLYTDGLMEGKNIAGEMYGKKRMRRQIESHINDGPEKVLNILIGDYQEHGRGKSLDDDVTFAIAKLTSPQQNGTA